MNCLGKSNLPPKKGELTSERSKGGIHIKRGRVSERKSERGGLGRKAQKRDHVISIFIHHCWKGSQASSWETASSCPRGERWEGGKVDRVRAKGPSREKDTPKKTAKSWVLKRALASSKGLGGEEPGGEKKNHASAVQKNSPNLNGGAIRGGG